MSVHKITYFNEKGRAQPILIAFQIGNIPYELETIAYPDFKADKENTARFPLGQVPVLSYNGRVITQSSAIARYAGKLAGLYPEDPLEALLVDEIIDTTAEITSSAPQNPDAEVKKTLREEWAATKLKNFLRFLSSKVNHGTYLVGGKLSLADLYLFFSIKSLRTGTFDYVPVDADAAFPALGQFFDFLKADPVFARFA